MEEIGIRNGQTNTRQFRWFQIMQTQSTMKCGLEEEPIIIGLI